MGSEVMAMEIAGKLWWSLQRIFASGHKLDDIMKAQDGSATQGHRVGHWESRDVNTEWFGLLLQAWPCEEPLLSQLLPNTSMFLGLRLC